MRVFARAFAVAIVAQAMLFEGASAQSTEPTFPISPIERYKRGNVPDSLQDMADFGDDWSPDTGEVSFRQVDVSIPGNSALPVEVSRMRSRDLISLTTKAHPFGDWDIGVPRIEFDYMNGTPDPTGTLRNSRCGVNLPFSARVNLPGGNTGQVDLGTVVANFTMKDLSGGSQLLMVPMGNTDGWAGSSIPPLTTKSFWRISCIGTSGYLARSPDGTEYQFDIELSRSTERRFSTSIQNRGRRIQVFPSIIRDVHGNTVQYQYNAFGPTAIISNDGRRIDFTYNARGNIESASANGRVWNYQYSNGVLTSVTRPDGRQWSFTSLSMLESGLQADGDALICGTSLPGAAVFSGAATITNPYGAQLSMRFRPIRNGRVGYDAFVGIVNFAVPCWESVSANFHFTGSLALADKTISVGGQNNVWTYDYQQDNGQKDATFANSTKKRTIIDPLGYRKELLVWRQVYLAVNQLVYPTPHPTYGLPLEGAVVDEAVFATSTATQPLRRETRKYDVALNSFYWLVGNLFKGQNRPYPGESNFSAIAHATLVQRTITQDGDAFVSDYIYDNNPDSLSFSFGSPTRVSDSSSISGGLTRVTDTVYEHNRTNWVLSLPSTVTRNSKLFDSYTYDSVGRLLTQSKFGSADFTYTYHLTGAQAGRIHTVTDAGNDTYTLTNWKRGQPQTTLRPDGLTTSRIVDDNGWVLSETNARGFATGYEYNPLGWPTRVNPPAGWSETLISYAFGSGVTETREKSRNRITTTYDGLMRPTLVKTEPLAVGEFAPIYEKKAYDILGRETFKSWPTTSSNPIDGVDTIYDALSRVTSARENVTPFAETRTRYLSGGVNEVTDPSGAVITTTSRAFGSPEAPEIMRVIDAMGAETTMDRDIHGNIRTLIQSGTQNGFTTSVARNFWYNNDLLLCRHRAPEFGDEVFVYDAENLLIEAGRGAAAADGCVTSVPTAIRITRGYDVLDRETSVSFPSGTPNIIRTYDPNGNVTNVIRGNVWTYAYNEMDLLTEEKLSIDGRVYEFDYDYDAMGFVLGRSNVHSGAAWRFDPDGLGRPQSARIGTTFYVGSVDYHPNGLIADADYLSGQLLTQTLTTRQLPDVLKTVKPGGTNAVWLDYEYDARRKISSVADLDGTGGNESRTYTYDPNGRLLSAAGPWGAGSFKYDALGNLREQKLGNRTIAISYDAATNRVASANNGGTVRAYAYDVRGNATGVAGNGFTYDFSNQPTAVSGAATANYAYDGNLKRVKEVRGGKTIYTIYSKLTGGLIYRDEATDVIKTDYVNAGGAALRLKKTGTGAFTPQYTHFDAQGSPVTATGPNGASSWRERYAPFGEELLNPAGNADNTGYTGHLKDDATGLNYMQARYYDPIIGRFLSTDPIGYQDQLNLYAYVHNDPVNKVDPTGEYAESLFDVGFIVADIIDIASNGLNAANGASLAGNIVGLALPGATGVGLAARGAVEGAQAASKGIAKNAADGAAREAKVSAALKAENPGAKVQNQQSLRTADGKIAKDPKTGEGRRVDHAVIKDGKAQTYETTSMTADKTGQLAKEQRIIDSGGSYVRDRDTKQLAPVCGVSDVKRC